MAFKPGVGNIATYSEGKLKKKIQIYTKGGLINSLALNGKLSSSYAGSSNFEGDLIVEGNFFVSGTTTFGDAAVDLSKHTGKFSSSYAGTNNFEGDLIIEGNLSVSGSAAFAGATIDTDYGLVLPNNSTTGRIKAHSLATYSSKVLKTNIDNIKNPMEKVMSLRGVTYNWKNSGDPDIGLIAEEVQEVFPEVVHEGKDYLALDYSRLTSVLVEAVKEQQKEIKNQKMLIKQLFEKIDKINSD